MDGLDSTNSNIFYFYCMRPSGYDHMGHKGTAGPKTWNIRLGYNTGRPVIYQPAWISLYMSWLVGGIWRTHLGRACSMYHLWRNCI